MNMLDASLAVLLGFIIAGLAAWLLVLQMTGALGSTSRLGMGIAALTIGAGIVGIGMWIFRRRRRVKDTSLTEWKDILLGALPGFGIGLVLLLDTTPAGGWTRAELGTSIGFSVAVMLFGMVCCRFVAVRAAVRDSASGQG